MGDDNPAFFKQNQTARETAGQEATVQQDGVTVTVSANDDLNGQVLSSSNSTDSVLEVCEVAVNDTFTEDVRLQFIVKDSPTTIKFTVIGGANNFPVVLDPGLPIDDGDEIVGSVNNFSSNQVTVLFRALRREI